MGAGGHADDPLHSSRGDYAEHPDITLLQRPPHLVPAHQGGGGVGPGLVHVPGQYGSDEVEKGISSSGW